MKKTVFKQDTFRCQDLLRVFLVGIISIIGIVVLFKYFIGITVVEGTSMHPALNNNDVLLITHYIKKEPKRYDIVLFRMKSDKNICVKRIIGLPGESVQIKEGSIFINGECLEEYFGKELLINNAYDMSEIQIIPENQYFVLGDNRNNSTDSRKKEVGFICKEDFIGKAFFRLYPFNAFGSLNSQ